jgi:hypothetical protein
MKKALLIGIDYIDISGISLKGCINDVINMRNMLIDAYDYESNNIIMLRDDDANKFPSPTNDNIVDSIIDLVLESANLEEVWLHYSGHGSQIQKQNCDSGKSETAVPLKLIRSETLVKSSDYNDKNCINGDKMQILVPVDYKTNGCIVDRDLYDMVRRFKCRAILTFDCCHSGTVCDLPWTTDYHLPTTLTDIVYSSNVTQLGMLVTTKISDAIIKNPNIFMFSGCRDDQTSLDTINDMDQRSGAFTNALCECLRASHHNTSILLLYKDICIYLLERGYEQIPVLSSTVETPKHIITKNQMNVSQSFVIHTSEAGNHISGELMRSPFEKTKLEKTEKLTPEQAAMFQGYGSNPLTLHDNLVGQGLLHQYRNPIMDNFMNHSEGKFVGYPHHEWRAPPPTGHHPTYHTKMQQEDTCGFLPIISSGDSVSTSSSYSGSLSSLYRHFYKRKAGKL